MIEVESEIVSGTKGSLGFPHRLARLGCEFVSLVCHSVADTVGHNMETGYV